MSEDADAALWPHAGTAKPYTRWWWLNGPFGEAELALQLRWLADHGFGGVEIAWLYPSWGDVERDRPEWLGEDWSRLVAAAKRSASELGLGCDFTFGSVWPFGGTGVPAEHRSRTLDGLSTRSIRHSWEEPEAGHVIDHLSARALRFYCAMLAPAFRPALGGAVSALFCDSLEVDKHRLWSDALWEEFEARFGYSLRDHATSLESDPGVLYDYRTLVGDAILREFYEAFAAECRELGAVSRVQCHGAPTDLLAAYAAVDVPESETLLFPPGFSRIPASAAALAGKPVVSCETFTCIYGFPNGETLLAAVRAWKREDVADLRLLADAVFANGVNHIVWHGTPFNPPGGTNEFYASVHVGPDSPLVPDLARLNAYLARVSGLMRRGRTLARLAVYLPNEDMLLAGDLPQQGRVPASVDYSEMRTVRAPRATEGYAPIWVSRPFLANARFGDGVLRVGAARVGALVIDVEWMDARALRDVHRLVQDGLPVALLREPRQPGHVLDESYDRLVGELVRMTGVVDAVTKLPVPPLVEGSDLPAFWARECDGEELIFFAHPGARHIRYPMVVGDAREAAATERTIRINGAAACVDVALRFEPGRSVLVRLRGETVTIERLDPAD